MMCLAAAGREMSRRGVPSEEGDTSQHGETFSHTSTPLPRGMGLKWSCESSYEMCRCFGPIMSVVIRFSKMESSLGI